MSGKYSKLRGVIPAFQEETSYQQRVDSWKQGFLCTDDATNVNVNMLARNFAERKADKDKLEERISALNVELEALSQLLVEALEDQNIQKVELASGAICFLQDTPYPVVKDRDAVLEWIKKERMQSLLSVHYQTLKAMTSERLIAGKPCIPGTEVYLKTQARIRNARNGDSNDE